MDDETRQLEAELERLQPVAPSRALLRRIESELASAPASRTVPWVEWILAAALPAAAAIALILTQVSPRQKTRPGSELAAKPTPTPTESVVSESPLKPVAAEKVLVSAADEGLVTLDDGTQARRERLRYVDTIMWKNPRTNASLTWSVPREEVRVVPIAFQ